MLSLKKIRRLGLIQIALAAFVGFIFAVLPMRVQAGELRGAPVNPEFMAYVQNQGVGLMRSLSDEGYPLGYIPPPIKLPRVKTQTVLSEAAVLPAKFDLRTLGGVTPVKDQGSCGDCWAFATYGSMESFLKYKVSQIRDYSEADLNRYHGFDPRECEGGNHWMSTAYLARWSGPVNTADVPNPYAAPLSVSTPGAKVRKHVQNVWFLPERSSFTDNTTLKTAVRTYGGVTIYFQWAATYFNPTNAAYYTDQVGNNHNVTVVGWDDNYTRTKFNAGFQPPGDGAFIVKNSWGSSWGDNGYFYISYYDNSLSPGAAFYNAEATTNYKRAYEYDPLGWVDSLGFIGTSPTTAWFANVFKASASASKINAVSFYTPVPNTAYRIMIYKDVAGGANPRNGTLVKSLSGTLAKSGYNTVKTYRSDWAPPAVTGGKKFSVVVKLTTPGYDYPIPVEEDYYGYSSAANANTGQSFVSEDGVNWDDLTTFTSFERTNVCVKAFGG
jgi:C1A family cysteine protease